MTAHYKPDLGLAQAGELLDWLEAHGLRGELVGPDRSGWWAVRWEE